MKKCPNCNNDLPDYIDQCPYCHYVYDYTTPQVVEVIETSRPKDGSDIEFRIENDASKFVCLKNDTKALVIIIALVLLFVGILAFWGLILMTIGFDSKEITLLGVGILLTAGSLALVGVAIKFIAIRSKTKYLFKNGIVLKNVKFKRVKITPAFTKVVIEYTDGEGNQHIFKGTLPTNSVKNIDICDVCVDPKNYKKYLVRDNIF